jgi:pSer/pThr/pTyr-binding forkhead associated (FHA) protein
LGPSNQDLELEHTRIVRQTDGTFLVEDNHSRIGTRLNNQPLQYPMRLNDGDVIKLGRNSVRFNERQRRSDDTAAPSAATSRTPVPAPPPPAKRTPAPQKPATAIGPVAPAASPSSPERKSAADLPHSPIKVASPPTEKKRGPPPPLPPPPRPKR